MMWMAIDHTGNSILIKCPDRLDSVRYQQQIILPNLSFIRRRASNRHDEVIFMQDGASCHRSASTLRFLRENRVNFLENWPPQSPDCNPVEHCWAWLAKQLIGKSFFTEAALESAIQSAWAARPPTLIPNLYGSMVRRLTAVQVAKGGPTNY